MAWLFLGLLVRVRRIGFALFGRTRTVDTIIYKADRLGDWFLAEPTVERIVDSARRRGGSVVVWAAEEGDAARAWRPPAFEVETFSLEPKGVSAKFRRALAVAGLLARYRARAFVSLRHSPEPVRDFVLDQVEASERHALSWLIYDGPPASVPHEIARHEAILRGLGIPSPGAPALLPRIGGWSGEASRDVVVTPYSSSACKDWEDGRWREIIELLFRKGFRVEVWVGPGQRKRAQDLLSGLALGGPGSGAVVKTGTLGDLALAIGTARLVLTVDTVTAHLAASIDAPMVCLLGGGQYGDFGPWGSSPRQRWVTQVLSCYGCDWRCTRPTVECLLTIATSRVASEVETALAAPVAEGRPD
ncbi:MAG TPA: glycosyltransferase family 9 protein [Opitutaceae bacterium]|jgi:hypothetical protein